MLTRSALMILGLSVFLAMPGQPGAKERSAKDQALFEKARKDCSSPRHPNGARPFINYTGGWYRCVEPGSSRR